MQIILNVPDSYGALRYRLGEKLQQLGDRLIDLQYLWEMPWISPDAVEILKLPLVLTATRPIYAPIFLPFMTTALTMSPVWKFLTNLNLGTYLEGKPNLSVLQDCLEPWPLAVISNGLTFTNSGKFT